MSFACPAIVFGIDRALCQPVDLYCERMSGAIDAEPINAFSNFAFVVAAGFAWGLWHRYRNPENFLLVPALILLILTIGIFSFVFHTAATRWAEWGDVIPIQMFILLYLWFLFTRFFDWSWPATLLALVAFLLLSLYLEYAMPAEFLWGGAMYLPTLVMISVMGIAMRRRWPIAGGKMIAAAGLFVIAFGVRTLDMRICPGFAMGTHFLWHILNALLLYLLVRLAILHAPRSILSAW